MKPKPDIEENIIDFMHAYNLTHATASITTTQTQTGGRGITNLRILSKNINGHTEARLKPDAQLMLDIVQHEPHIVMMQEHLLKKLNTKAFRKRAQITGYKLIIHSKARKEDHRKGRHSGGLAIWVHEFTYEAYIFQNILNISYIQKLLMTPKNNADNQCVLQAITKQRRDQTILRRIKKGTKQSTITATINNGRS